MNNWFGEKWSSLTSLCSNERVALSCYTRKYLQAKTILLYTCSWKCTSFFIWQKYLLFVVIVCVKNDIYFVSSLVAIMIHYRAWEHHQHIWGLSCPNPPMHTVIRRFVTTPAPSGLVIKTDFCYLHPSYSMDGVCESLHQGRRWGRSASPKTESSHILFH